jgi:hypothetical protein
MNAAATRGRAPRRQRGGGLMTAATKMPVGLWIRRRGSGWPACYSGSRVC